MSRLDTLLKFHEEDPDDAFLRFAVASEYLKTGDLDRALEWFEGLAAGSPDYVGTWYHLGGLYARLGREEDAVRTYETGIAVATRQADHHSRSELERALAEVRTQPGNDP